MPSTGRAAEVAEQQSRAPLLVVLLGPTAAGKTVLALRLAGEFGGEIVSCDSVAVYREFEIGTAKPTREERKRAPHHLMDVLAPTEPCTAGDYARMARAALNEIKERNHVPIVVGGTGLYLRALVEGLFAGPPRSEELRERLRDIAETKTSSHLHKMLKRLDREAAEKIHANDAAKLIRAVEVCLASRSKMTELWRRGRSPLTGFRILRIGLSPERNALYVRINQRAKRMFDAGLVEEARSLHEKYGANAHQLSALGYKQAMQHIRGEINLKLAIWAAQQAHRNYAKRQLTWFRREPSVHWLHGFGDDPKIAPQAADLVKNALVARPELREANL